MAMTGFGGRVRFFIILFLTFLHVPVIFNAAVRAVGGEFTCPASWHINKDTCYYVSDNELVTWHQAGDICRLMNASLVSIKSADVDNFIDTIVKNPSWIGLHDFNEVDKFTWMDDTPVNYTKWAEGEPNNAGENCVSVYAHYNKGSWNDVVCRKKNRYICQRTNNVSGSCGDPAVWHEVLDQCIQFSTEKVTWMKARLRCREAGGDLAVIRNETENELITGLMPYSDFWIGLNDRSTEGVFAWLDDTEEAPYFNWHSGEPNNGNNGLEDCVNMITGYNRKGQWATEGCSERYWFACEMPTATNTHITVSAENDTDTTQLCSPGWVSYNTNCYHIATQLLTWQGSRVACRAMGADLVVIESEEEQTFLNSHPNFTSQNVWIGLHDLVERETWSWVGHNEPISGYTNWARNEPSTSSPRSDCVMLHVTSVNMGRWSAARCHRTLAYICEADSPGYCEEGWTIYNGHCYHINTTELSWLNAEKICSNKSSHAHLVTIDDTAEQHYIEGQLQQHRGLKGFWIGLNSRRKANVFVWPNHLQPVYSNWDRGQPVNVTDEKCVERMSGGRGKGKWNDQNCMDEKAYVCQQPADGDHTYYDFVYNNSIYKIVWYQMAQTEGETFCRLHLGANASLWQIHNRDELASVGGELARRIRGTNIQVWIAGDPTIKGTFVYYGKNTPYVGPGRRCMMVAQERVYTTDWGYRSWTVTPPPNAAPEFYMSPRPCCEEKMLICEKKIDGQSQDFEDPLGRSLYRLVGDRSLSYNDAMSTCQQLLGDDAGLAIVESEEEQLILSAEVKARHRGGTVEYWLGRDSGGQTPHLLRGPRKPGQNCVVFFHENIRNVPWDKEVFDIIPSGCQGAKQFICELKLTAYVEAGSSNKNMNNKDKNDSVAKEVTASELPPSGIKATLTEAGCIGPCVGLAIAYPFSILFTILLTVLFIWVFKSHLYCASPTATVSGMIQYFVYLGWSWIAANQPMLLNAVGDTLAWVLGAKGGTCQFDGGLSESHPRLSCQSMSRRSSMLCCCQRTKGDHVLLEEIT